MRFFTLIFASLLPIGVMAQDTSPKIKLAPEASPIPQLDNPPNLEPPKKTQGPETNNNASGKKSGQDITPPILSESNLKTFTLTIPAPRGLITDRNGQPLAQTAAVKHFSLFLPGLTSENDAPVSEVLNLLSDLAEQFKDLPIVRPSPDQIESHWKNRKHLPMLVTGPVKDKAIEARVRIEFPQLKEEVRYERAYPAGPSVSHIVGYVRPEMPEQYGPLKRADIKWPKYVAESGLEHSMDNDLRGEDGEVNLLFNLNGDVENRVFSKLPRPGNTIVTSINLEMQKLAYELLKKEGRPGAIVAIDSNLGDILAMVTYPSFDASGFIDGIGQAEYAALRDDKDAPLFNRAYQGAYPPGSTFKPFVGLAALNSGAVYGTSTMFPGPPYLEIDGRRFNNWNDEHEGTFDIRYALMRSSNTWFYRAGILTGSRPIIETALSFGFGRQPDIPLANVAKGNMPPVDDYMVNQGIANMSIGQGDVLASPLQLASAMGGLANGIYVAEPKLILQEQEPLTNYPNQVHTLSRNFVNYRRYDLDIIRAGMWGVVNHKYGTGKAGANPWPMIHGKTGTSQWSTDGEERPMVWFAGFAGTGTPKIAFTVMLQGEPGEVLYGGRNAAPIAGEFLNTIYNAPEKFGIEIPPRDTDPAMTNIQVPTEAGSGGTVMAGEPERIKRLDERVASSNEVMSDEQIRQMVNSRSYSGTAGQVRARPVEPLDTPESRNEEKQGVLKSIFQILKD